MCLQVFVDFVACWVAYVSRLQPVFLHEEVCLKRQDEIEVVHVASQCLDTMLFPSPDFWCNVIIDRTKRFAGHVSRHFHVKPRIVHQNYGVGSPSFNFTPTLRHAAQNGAQVTDDGDKPHIGQRAEMAKASVAHGRHLVATDEAELGLVVFGLEGFHQPSGMEVAAGFAGNQKIFHSSGVGEEKVFGVGDTPIIYTRARA